MCIRDSLYGSALKDNPYLERAMLTGIHRIAKENIFSGLNNLDVCTAVSYTHLVKRLTEQHQGQLLLGCEDLVFTVELMVKYHSHIRCV